MPFFHSSRQKHKTPNIDLENMDLEKSKLNLGKKLSMLNICVIVFSYIRLRSKRKNEVD